MNFIEKLSKKLINLSLKYYRIIFIIIVIPFILKLPYIFPITINNTLDTLLEQGTIQETIDRKVKDSFGEMDEIIILAYHDKDIFSPENIRLIQKITETIEKIKGIRDCFSLANTPYFSNETDEDGDSILISTPLLSDFKTDDIATLKDKALKNKTFVKNIISEDGNTVAFNIILDKKLSAEKKERTVKEIRLAIKPFKKKVSGKFYLTGMHVFMETTGRNMQEDIFQFSLLSILALFITLLLIFRNITLPLTGLICAGISNGLLFLVLNFMDRTLSISTTPVPAITMGLTIAYSLHFLVSKYEDKLDDDEEIKEIFSAILISSFTTMIGFYSISFNPIPTLQDLGLYASIGTFFAAFVALFITFPITRIIPCRKSQNFGSIFKNFLLNTAISKRKLILFISFLIFLSGGLLFTMKVQTDYYKYYRKSSPLTKNVDFVNREIGGQYPILIALSSNKNSRIFKKDVLDFMKDFKKKFEKIDGVDKIITYLDLLDEGYRAYTETSSDNWYYNENQIPQIAMIVKDANKDLNNYYINDDESNSMIFIRTSHINTAAFKNVINRIREYIKNTDLKNINIDISGTYLRTVNSADKMAMGQLKGTFLAIIVIFTIVFFIINSLRITLIAFTANILPILGIYGLLGFLGETLNMGTTTIAAIALGIGVDDTVHFLTRFITESRKGGSNRDILQRTFNNSGMAILFTSIIISFTFLSMIFSNIKPLFQLGLYTTVAMLLCLVADLFLLPVLLTSSEDIQEK